MNFAIKNVYGEIPNQSKEYARVDIVTDSCRNDINRKEITHHRRGIGMYVEFDSNTPLPIDFVKDFHRSSENKDKFYSYLVSFIHTSFMVR